MNKKNGSPCFVFAMGMEAAPFLHRVETKERWKIGSATYREVFFEGKTFLVVRCGIGPSKATASIRGLQTRPSVIISVGTAGALAPDLKVRDLVVSGQTTRVSDPAPLQDCSPTLVDAVVRACNQEGLPCRVARVATSHAAIFSLEERKRLHEFTGAVAVDMESHAVGQEALRLGVPFASLRVISDDIHSPPLPEPKKLKALWREPKKLPRTMRDMLRWAVFLRDFRASVKLLPPVLVRLMRNYP